MRTLVDVQTTDFRITGISCRALTEVTSRCVDTIGSNSANRCWADCALVHIDTAIGGRRIASVSRRTRALVGTGSVGALRSRTTRVGLTFVDIPTFHGWIAFKTQWTVTDMTARKVLTYGSPSATARIETLVDVCAGNGRIACEARFAFANKVTWEVTALGVIRTQTCQRWDLTFVDVMT